MKTIYVSMATVFFLFVGFSNTTHSQTITISGAGIGSANGTYTLTGTYNTKDYYMNGGNTVWIAWQNNKWTINSSNNENNYYNNAANTTMPPNIGWQIGGDGTAPAPVASGNIASLLVGDGTSGAPYQISSLNSLYWIALNSAEWGKYFVQTADINASETSTWFGGAGWTPIASLSEKFTGSYNGGGFSISGLTINRPASNAQGLFFSLFNAVVSEHYRQCDCRCTIGIH